MRRETGAEFCKGVLHAHISGHLTQPARRPTNPDGEPSTVFGHAFGRHHPAFSSLLRTTESGCAGQLNEYRRACLSGWLRQDDRDDN